MRNLMFSSVLLLLMTPFNGLTTTAVIPASIQQLLPQSMLVGSGRLSYLFWDIYDAYLYAPHGNYQPSKPCALRLSYLRDLNGADIADRTIEEMRLQGIKDELLLADWHSQMKAIIPNVQAGTELIGFYTDEGYTLFYHDNRNIGEIKNTAFSQSFFRIWLGQQTSEPQLRQALLGQ